MSSHPPSDNDGAKNASTNGNRDRRRFDPNRIKSVALLPRRLASFSCTMLSLTTFLVVVDADESDHFFCGLGWGDVSNDCDAAQHCPTGADAECEVPGAVCFGGTECDASMGHGKYFQYLGLAYEDTRNRLFCASSYADAASSCSIDRWCRDGTCPDGLSCFGGLDCNIQNLFMEKLEAEKEEAKANGVIFEDDDGGADEEEENSAVEEDKESNHFFCGLDWNTVGNDCDKAQHCPSGTDDECELKGAICFGGTTCDSAKGHGELFRYLGLPYEDARNRLFCASNWMEAESNCSVEYWCRDGTCENSMSCFGGLDCNIQDLINAELEQQKEANGEADDGGGKPDKVVLSADDPKRHNFCGMSWGDASYQCSEWCPEGVECPAPQQCFADTDCFYDRDIVPSASPTTYPPTQSPTITYDRAENMSFCGTGWGDATRCTAERHCPNGDGDCPPSESCYNYIPGCNIVDLIKAQKPASPPSMPPSRRPTDRPVTPAPTVLPARPKPTMLPITSSPTIAPFQWAIEWVDVDEDKEEEGFSESEFHKTKLFCGETQQAAALNCSLNRYDCSDGICPNGLKCFVIAGLCNDGAGQKEEEEGATADASSPISSPTAPTGDVSSTFFCGANRDDASTCHKRCPRGMPGECPPGESCFGYISCAGEIPGPPPTGHPTPTHRPGSNVGVRQNYCAGTRAALELVCAVADTCNAGDPPCPAGTFCWGDHACAGVKIVTMLPTSPPTKMAGAAITLEIKPTPPNPMDMAAGTGTKPFPTYDPTTLTYAPTKMDPTPIPTRRATANPIPIQTRRPTKPSTKMPTRYANDQQGAPESGTPDLYPTKSTYAPTKMNPTPIPTRRPIKSQTIMPTRYANDQQGAPESGTPDLYCASSMAELETSCSWAQSCKRGPCPKGQFCFPFACKSSSAPKDEPIDGPFYCATSLAELDERCALATECTGNGGACPRGQSCLRYGCKQSLDRCPLNYIGWHASQDCITYYECSNGVAGDAKTCEELLKFDKVRGLCVPEDLVDQHCYGGPSDETFYCATSLAELDERCGLATECTSDGRPCPGGQSCLRYDCRQSLDMCPLNYVGWHSSQDCEGYYECLNGVAGATRMCGKSLKFDKVRGLCVPEDLVDQHCYGGPSDETFYCATSLAELDERCGLATQCTGVGGPCPEGQSCLRYDCRQSLDMCPLNYVGWHASRDCEGYYECSNGVAGVTRMCGKSLKFDKGSGRCVSDHLVDQYCYGPAASEFDAEEQQERVTCPKRYVGWYSGHTDCREYFECRMDGSVGPTHVCGEGTKFDKVRKICFDEGFVNDFCEGPALEADTSDDAGNGFVLGGDDSSGLNVGGPDEVVASDNGEVENVPVYEIESSGEYASKPSDALNGHMLGHDESPGANDQNPHQMGVPNHGSVPSLKIDTSSGESAGNPSATPSAQPPRGGNPYQTSITSDGNHASEIGMSLGAADNPSPASPVQLQMTPSPEVSGSTPPPSLGRKPPSPFIHGDGFRDDTSWPKTAPPTLNMSSPEPAASNNTLATPPWYLYRTVVDPNGGRRIVTQFTNTYTLLVSFATIHWIINS